MAFGLGVTIVVCWVIVLGGIAYIAFAFAAVGAGAFILRLLIGIMYLAGGLYLLFHPETALESLTLLLALFFLVEGVFECGVYYKFRKVAGSSWLLIDGLVSLLLAYLIGRPWPVSSVWAVGTLLGINLIFSGTTRIMYAHRARKSLAAV
jgi:uncharacterized membrane protein HdeD (DUF308 family)